MDWWFFAGEACLIFAGFFMILTWLFDLWPSEDGEITWLRRYMQWQIDWCVELLADDRIGEEQWEELQWTLHGLLFEYRTLFV